MPDSPPHRRVPAGPRYVALALAALLPITGAAAALGRDGRYWTLDGRATLLAGASIEDNLFQVAGLEPELDQLQAAGGNYVRNTLSSRDPGNLWPFAAAQSGQAGAAGPGPTVRRWLASLGLRAPLYDLERPNEAYFARLERLLALADERGIVVQIELWDRFDYARAPWRENPFNPDNNINYTEQASRLAASYPEHPARNRNSFFRSIPALDDNPLLLGFQQAWIDRVLAVTLRFDNVLYCVSNETSGAEAWSRYWAEYLRAAASAAGRRIHVTEMWDAWELDDAMHARTLDDPVLYDYFDASQNNHQSGDAHWESLVALRERLAPVPRPFNNVKIYGGESGRYGTAADAIDRFWRNVLAGAASVRFHRPPNGLGPAPAARAQLAAVRRVAGATELAALAPANALLADREPGEAYLAAAGGEAYLAYFPAGGSVGLTLPPPAGAAAYRARWLRPGDGPWQVAPRALAPGLARIATPDGGRWLLLIEPDRDP